MKTILGYADQISVTAGDDIAFKVSSERPFDAAIVRIRHGDTNPAGPGYREVPVPGAAWQCQGRRQQVHAGSCALLPVPDGLLRSGFGLELLMLPTTPDKSGQVVASLWDPSAKAGMLLCLDQDGLSLRLRDGEGQEAFLRTGVALRAGAWFRVHVALTREAGHATLTQSPLRPCAGFDEARTVGQATGLRMPARISGDLVLAARRGTSDAPFTDFYNGRIEAPRISDTAGKPVADWDFSQGIDTGVLHDRLSHRRGSCWQVPSRAVVGHNWDGTEFAWPRAPAQYAAIHFHDDDIADAGWETDFSWQVPRGLRSGLYAARLRNGNDEDYIPFVIRKSADLEPAPLLFILPTASYVAYANEHLALDAPLAERVHDHLPVFGPADLFLAGHRNYGGSLYDRHSDGSGVMTSSRLRPMLNMRPKYQSWLGGTGSSVWQLNSDTHILDWLEAKEFSYDCATDEDLHSDPELLTRYRCVMLGTHPEYTSTAMRAALTRHRDAGGRLISPGGNALYWRIAFHPSQPGIIEVRRSEVGNGWITPPGEAYHAFSGEYGGLWSRIGSAPQELLGAGFIGQGFDRCGHYRRLDASHDPRAAFIFDGVTGAIIGAHGLVGGGAAGIELDRSDAALGTPQNALILARSEGHSNSYLPTLEVLLINHPGQGAATSDRVRAEMMFFETVAGGAVFATGSIAWSGSLSHNGYDNDVSRITANVLHRFIDPEPFTVNRHKDEPDA